MLSLLQRLRLEIAAPAALALTIFVVACGSSSPAGLREAGQSLRWVALGTLLLIATAYALARPKAPRVWITPLLPLVGLTALAAASTAWSVEPRLTFERASSFAIVVGTACLLAYATAEDPAARGRLVRALMAGGTLVAAAGLVLLAIDRELVTIGSPTRFRGLGENPNTVALLAALAAPAAAWSALEARSRTSRAVAWTSFAVSFGSLVAAQSRGAIVAVGAGLVFLTLLLPRPALVRAGVVGGAAVLLAVGIQLSSLRFDTIVTTTRTVPAKQDPAAAQPNPTGDTAEIGQPPTGEPAEIGQLPTGEPAEVAQTAAALGAYYRTFGKPGQFSVAREEEFGHPFFTGEEGKLGVVSSSGRIEAWRGALSTAMSRPLLGHGFGTEDRVFVDRYYSFKGARPENGYLGWLLQLGAAGLAAFAVFAAAVLAALIRARRSSDPTEWSVTVGLGAVAAAGIVAALTQSYLYSAGNIAMLTFWVAAAAVALSSRAARG